MDVLLILILSLPLQEAATDVQIYTDGGWKPIIKSYKDYDKTTNTQNERQWKPPNTIDNIILGDFIEVIDPPDVTKGFMANAKEIILQDIEPVGTSEMYDTVLNNEDYYNTEYEDIKNKPDLEPQQRRERKLNHDTLEDLNNKIYTKIKNIYTPNSNTYTKIEPNYIKDNKANNTYEVKEKINDDHVLAADNNHNFANIVKQKFHPGVKAYTDYKNNNLTSNFLNILANYNIRTSDKLLNYPLSLRQNSRNQNYPNFMYMQLPLKIPLKYNNANHLPVDPLLAVFLSNYGQYVPGLFGFSRNYQNLYGYLASNNIHNNKPFGPYKLFSDTDSAL